MAIRQNSKNEKSRFFTSISNDCLEMSRVKESLGYGMCGAKFSSACSLQDARLSQSYGPWPLFVTCFAAKFIDLGRC